MSVEYLSLAEGRLAYQREVGDAGQTGIVFLGGYASDMQGGKAGFLAESCVARSIPFVRFDYRGCGLSPGDFTARTLGDWLDDSLAVIERLTDGPQIIVGSSMGGWLGLLAAQARPERLKAFIGIAAAPDFTEDLVWEKLTPEQRKILQRDGKIYDDNAPPDHRVPMTVRLIEEARNHLILRDKIRIACPVRLLHGLNDSEVPWNYAPHIAEKIAHEDVRVTLIKNGDHRLSTPPDLQVLWQTIVEFI